MASKGDIQATRSALQQVSTTAAEAIDATETEIDLTSAASFPTSGTILIESEVITYTGKSTNTLTGCVRGANGTTAATHANTTPVTLMQQIIIPPIRLRAITVASDGTGAGSMTLTSNDGISLLIMDVPNGDVLNLNMPEDGILFPKGIFLTSSVDVAAFTLFTDKYSGKGLTA
tara:strand:- start:1601 stop:2122 length:522 start_codon:yes stop_codon:yes gene_type:complete